MENVTTENSKSRLCDWHQNQATHRLKLNETSAQAKGVISRWKRELLDNGENAFPGKGCLKAGDEELRRLKCENKRLDICPSCGVLLSTYYNH